MQQLATETPGFAGLMGRMDMAFSPAITVVTGEQPTETEIIDSTFGVKGEITGRISAGLLAGLVIGVVGFYIWTRGFQL